MANVYKCEQYQNQGDGGVYKDVIYARTREDMLILKDQGYKCYQMVDAGGEAPPVWVEA